MLQMILHYHIGSIAKADGLNVLIIDSTFSNYSNNAALYVHDRGLNSNGFNNTLRIVTRIYRTSFMNSYGNATSVLYFNFIANNYQSDSPTQYPSDNPSVSPSTGNLVMMTTNHVIIMMGNNGNVGLTLTLNTNSFYTSALSGLFGSSANLPTKQNYITTASNAFRNYHSSTNGNGFGRDYMINLRTDGAVLDVY